MLYLPFCPEHGIRIHKTGFVYFNSLTKENIATATKRNLMFNASFYLENFLGQAGKIESQRLCYENSEDAVTFNIFTELLGKSYALKKLIGQITKANAQEGTELYLWGGKIDLKNNRLSQYNPLIEVRRHLEPDIVKFVTEPDIMLVVPKKVLVCIEAKFGSKNPPAEEIEEGFDEKPKSRAKLIERYCKKNPIINYNEIFAFSDMPRVFYEQLFRNVVFAASMAKLTGIEKWYVVNLRSQHVINFKRGKPESMPVVRNVRKILRPMYKKRFLHFTWEDLYYGIVNGDTELHDLAWYMKNKTLRCGRAFNVF